MQGVIDALSRADGLPVRRHTLLSILWPSIYFAGICGAHATEDVDVAKYLLDGVMSARASWVTGIARVTGASSMRTETGWTKTDVDVTISFDTSVSSVRYDILAGGHKQGGVYIRTAEMQIECINEAGGVVVIKGLDESPSGFVFAPDLHAIGLLPVRDFLAGNTLDQFRLLLEQFALHSLKLSQSNSVLSLRKSLPDGSHELLIQINESRGFAVTEFAVRHLLKGESEPRVAAVTKTRWEGIDDTFVPVQMESEIEGRKCNLKIEWKSFNKSIDPSLFKVEHIGIRDGALIVDRRLGHGVIVGKLGVRDYIPPARTDVDTGDEQSSSQSSWIRRVLLGFNVLLVFALLFAVIKRRYRR